jgi:hypothetical protein
MPNLPTIRSAVCRDADQWRSLTQKQGVVRCPFEGLGGVDTSGGSCTSIRYGARLWSCVGFASPNPERCVCDAAYDAQQNVVPFDSHQTPVSSAGFKLQCSAECNTKRNTSNDYLMDCGVPSEPPYYYQVRRCSCCCPPTKRSRLILLVSSLHSVCTAPRHFRS